MQKCSNLFWSNKSPSSYVSTWNIWRRVRDIISLWPKKYEAGEFWREARKETADPQPPCTKIGSSLLDRAAEPTHFEPSWDPISQFATQGKGSIQDKFTRKTKQVILLPLPSLASAAAVQFVSPHMCHWGCIFPIAITGVTVCRAGFVDPLWFVESLQFAEFSARRWAGLLPITRCFTSVKVQAPDKFLVPDSSRAQLWWCRGTVTVRNASEHQTEESYAPPLCTGTSTEFGDLYFVV